MRVRLTAAALLALAACGACGDPNRGAGGLDERSERERMAEAMSGAGRDEVVAKARTPQGAPDGDPRIIYSPPPDLSYASAQLRRPDIVRPDTSRMRGAVPGGPPLPSAIQDTTAGDASADTSGGAARRARRP